MNMIAKRALPPTWLLVSIVSMLLLHLVIPVSTVTIYPWTLTGILPLLTGVILNLAADAAFRRKGTTVKPFELSTALITSGVFRLNRHPMYLGMVLILLGIAILLGSLSPFFVVAIFGVLMELVFIRPEEKMLEQQFGREWQAYKNKV